MTITARDKMVKCDRLYEPYVHSTGRHLMLDAPAWLHPGKREVRDQLAGGAVWNQW